MPRARRYLSPRARAGAARPGAFRGRETFVDATIAIVVFKITTFFTRLRCIALRYLAINAKTNSGPTFVFTIKKAFVNYTVTIVILSITRLFITRLTW